MGLFLLIAGAIIAGALVTIAVAYTIRWFKNRIKQKLEKKNVKKVAATTLEKLIDECPNEISINNLMEDGYTDLIVSVDYNGKVDEVEVIRNTNTEKDSEIERLLGSERMVVVTG